jgi:hypothetical protein
MARFDLKTRFTRALVCSLFTGLLFTLAAEAKVNKNCFDCLRKERAAILDHFGKLQNMNTYTEKHMLVLKARVEKYLIAIGDVLKNYDVDLFVREELAKIPSVKNLKEDHAAKLEETLAPWFKSKKVPTYEALDAALTKAGLAEVSARKIRMAMDKSFKIWNTKIVFDESGTSVFNALAKSYVQKMGMGEFSMDLGLLGKNEWEAFFDGENGAGIFNPSMPGLMADLFTSTEAHESVHMVVETLAAKGHESPYSVWIKVLDQFKSTGAIGERQKRALKNAEKALEDGDYYRTELYLDEFPAHVIQSAFLNVQLSKAMQVRLKEVVSGVRALAVKDELGDAYAEMLRSGKVEWKEYSDQTKRVFETWLKEPADDGRTKIAGLVTEMNQYMNWVDLIQDNGSTAVAEARKILDDAMMASKAAGLKGLKPTKKDLFAIKSDNFLGVPGYRVEVRIPIDVLGKDGNYVRTAEGATVNFRFMKEGDLTSSITPEKLALLVGRTDWVAELAAESRSITQRYAEFIDENGDLKNYTFADLFKIKQIHTDLRKLNHKTLERIRAGK